MSSRMMWDEHASEAAKGISTRCVIAATAMTLGSNAYGCARNLRGDVVPIGSHLMPRIYARREWSVPANRRICTLEAARLDIAEGG